MDQEAANLAFTPARRQNNRSNFSASRYDRVKLTCILFILRYYYSLDDAP